MSGQLTAVILAFAYAVAWFALLTGHMLIALVCALAGLYVLLDS